MEKGGFSAGRLTVSGPSLVLSPVPAPGVGIDTGKQWSTLLPAPDEGTNTLGKRATLEVWVLSRCLELGTTVSVT